MALPKVTNTLTSSAPAPNPQDISAIAHVVGPSSAGTLGVPTPIYRNSDLAPFGFGPGPELVAEILAEAGGPVYFTRSETTTASVTSAVTKIDPASAVGTAAPLYGSLVLAGADADGNVRFQAADPDVTLAVVNGGANGYAAVGKAVTLTVTNTATGTQIAALALGAAAGLLAQPQALGTGASVVGQSLSATALSKGGLLLTPKVQGPVRYRTVVAVGNDQALSVAVANTLDITITLGTTAGGQVSPVKNTATLVKTAIENAAGALVTVALAGDGTGMIGQQGSFASLQFGSTAALALSGTATDGLDLLIEIVRGGAVGASPAPTLRWSTDTLAGTSTTRNWSSETLIPANGVVQLKNGQFDTGLTATITGTCAVKDAFAATTTHPESSSSAFLVGVDAALALGDRGYQWGFLTSPTAVSKATAALVHTKLQDARSKGTRFVQALLNVRDVANETFADWRNSVDADYQGFVSARGIVTVCAGPVLHNSPLTLRQFRRPVVFAAAARKASIPIHENLGRVGRGPLSRVLYLYHNEDTTPQLADRRFVCPLTYPARPGFYYLTPATTMADPAAPDDAGFTLYERVSVALAIARIASSTALDYLVDSLEGTAQADPQSGAVKGALSLRERAQMESRINSVVEKFVFKAKSDGRASGTPMPPGQKMVKVRADNNFLDDSTINLDCGYIPLGLAKFINLTVTVTIPQ